MSTPIREIDLFGPVRDYLVAQGYSVQAEVKGCDVTATRDGELVAIELKRGFSVKLLLQATQRQRAADSVYVAIPRPATGDRSHWRGVRHLLRRLELGLIFVTLDADPPAVEVVFHPLPFERKRNTRGRRAILREMAGRSGEYNTGGSTRRAIVTAYRERAILIACCLEQHGPLAPRSLRALGCDVKAQPILSSNYYGWFERIEKGIYSLTPKGAAALEEYADAAARCRERMARHESAVPEDAE